MAAKDAIAIADRPVRACPGPPRCLRFPAPGDEARTMADVVLAKVLRAGEQKQVRRFASSADHIEALEEDYVDLTAADLRALPDTFRERLGDGETLDDLLP